MVALQALQPDHSVCVVPAERDECCHFDQLSIACDASGGGWAGRGPGEGRVKETLPDAHSDFVFAVAGEEFGLIACLIVLALFVFIVLRGISRVLKDKDLFVLLAVSGLLAQFGLQALINMASTVNLMPPKGMTLPFMSYGGSSTLALGLGLGMPGGEV